jgi:hypothetical protein
LARRSSDYEEEILALWYVSHCPDASFALADDLSMKKMTRKKPSVTGLC